MDVRTIFNFLNKVHANNNREWFALHKDEYYTVRSLFECGIVEPLLRSISLYDEDIQHVSIKDCVYRFYRDIRFSSNKAPYKTHFGAFITPRGLKKIMAGYYLHLEPNESVVAIGVYSPQNDLLKFLRKTVFENIDEWNEIVENKLFKKYFNGLTDFGDSLKKIPIGYPHDFEYPKLLTTRHYCFEYRLSNDFFDQPDWQKQVAELFRLGYPINRFLNFTIKEFYNIK